MRITLFGAAFDPPHLGHQQIAVSLIQQKLTDEVWLVPVKEHPFGKRLASPADRLAMTSLLAESINQQLFSLKNQVTQNLVRVETFELEETGISYSYRTLSVLSEKYSDFQFSFVIGSDNLSTFHKWDQYQAILTQFPIFVYPRHGYPLIPIYPGMKPMNKMKEVNISSTSVREKLKKGESYEQLVPPSIAAFMNKHQLYY